MQAKWLNKKKRKRKTSCNISVWSAADLHRGAQQHGLRLDAPHLLRLEVAQQQHHSVLELLLRDVGHQTADHRPRLRLPHVDLLQVQGVGVWVLNGWSTRNKTSRKGEASHWLPVSYRMHFIVLVSEGGGDSRQKSLLVCFLWSRPKYNVSFFFICFIQ